MEKTVSRVETPWLEQLEQQAFRAINAVMRPSIQLGLGAPCVSPIGLVVREHTGRLSDREYQSPLMALRVGRHVLVTTVREERSQWVRNLEDEPRTHLWMNGRRRPYRALVFRDAVESELEEKRLGRRLRRSLRGLLAAGFVVSVLEPA